MRSILVTGASGFLGRNLLPLLSQRFKIFAVSRTIPHIDIPNVTWVQADLATRIDFEMFPDKIDAIIHLAQSRHYKEFPEYSRDIFSVNTCSTLDLLDYGRKAGIKTFIYASSGGIYGNSYEKFSESDTPNPLNLYLSSKYSSELLVGSYKQFFNTVVFRFFFLYGPGQEGMLVSNLLSKVLNCEQITIDGTPGIKINPIYIDDAIKVFDSALDIDKSLLLNVAGDDVVSISDIVNTMSTITGRNINIKHTESHTADLIGDNTKMKEILKIFPTVSIQEGIRKMWAV